ncbi:fasciclin domain-containing protein [Lusitaniella coriacea]|uniref:fasciclin domain-containing protein n=1 Tax=Lusitaniella coriacea TaxID=1983105 RepID=UPI003CF5D009
MNTPVYKSVSRAIAVLTGIIGISASSLPVQAEISGNPATNSVEIAQATNSNIVEAAKNSSQFSTLADLIQTAGLANTLAGDGPFTVFAPNNAAFNALPEETINALKMPENRDLLTEILKYHVVPGRVPASALRTGAVDTLNGGLAVRVMPDGVVVNDGSVVTPDIPASNGLIHEVNRVMIPSSVRDRLAARMPVRGLW